MENETTIPKAVSEAMRRTNSLFGEQVVEKRDWKALDDVYTAGARVLPPGAPMIEGREGIREFWRNAVDAMSVTAARLSTVYAELAGDSVIEIGNADLSLSGGEIVTVKFVVQWKQEDGAWKWNLDIWNQ